MAKPLTIKALENLKPERRRREVPDGGVPGLHIITQPSGGRTWAYRYRFHGRPRKLTIGRYPAVDLKTARELAREALRKVAAGADPCAEKRAAKAVVPPDLDVVETVAARFITQYARRSMRPATAREVERILNKEIVGPWRGRRLSQIGRGDVHSLLDLIVERGSPIGANRTLSWLRRLYAWALERGIVETSPCVGIRPPAVEISRDRILADGELRAVWQAADALESPYGAFIKILILTGQRRGEVAEITWAEIDFASRIWTLPASRAKNGTEHTTPLPVAAIEILRAIPRIAGSDFVFTINGRAPIRSFHTIKARVDALAPLPAPWTIHDLRRSFASGCARLGVVVHVVEACLNHRSGSIRGIAAVYNRYDYRGEKFSAMEAWADYVAKLVAGEAAS